MHQVYLVNHSHSAVVAVVVAAVLLEIILVSVALAVAQEITEAVAVVQEAIQALQEMQQVHRVLVVAVAEHLAQNQPTLPARKLHIHTDLQAVLVQMVELEGFTSMLDKKGEIK
jgi:hypothetical protein